MPADPRYPSRNPTSSSTDPETPTRDGPTASFNPSGVGGKSGGTLPIIPDAPQVPGYIVWRELGRGGMGVVYAARDQALGRDVAIKTLLPKYLGNPEAIVQFKREAEITARLAHPGIPPVHALGTLPDHRPVLLMKVIEGHTLAALLQARQHIAENLPRLIQAFEQICQTVGFAHSRKFIHRDLKPQNVMVGAFAEVQVMDWGLAKELGKGAADTDPGLTYFGSAKGTPAYMPWEQARGEWDKVDTRADVFALGSILCVILTGAPAHTGEKTPEVFAKAVAGDVRDAYARLDACGVDPNLVLLCKRCLAPDQSVRPNNAGELAQEVATLRAAAEERARRAEAERVAAEARTEEANLRVKAEIAKAEEHRKRRKVQLALAGAVGLLILGGGAFAWWQDRQRAERKAEQQAAALRQQLEDEKRAATERERNARNGQAIELLLVQCEAALRKDDTQAATVSLTEAERRANEGGGEPHRARLLRCKKALTMLNELNRIDDLLWTVFGSTFNTDEGKKNWPVAFRAYEIIPGTTNPAEAGRRIRESPIRDRLLGALDRWLAWDITLTPDRSAALAAILKEADPDPYRDAVRAAFQKRDRAELVRLAAKPEALQQPAAFAVALGKEDAVSVERQTEILRATILRHPGDIAVLMELSFVTQDEADDRVEDREQWYRAALAARPTSPAVWNNLGTALAHRKDLKGAEYCYRESIRLLPTYSRVYNNLGVILEDKDVDAAIETYKTAIGFDPTMPEAHNNLGGAYIKKKEFDLAEASYREAIRLKPDYLIAHNNLARVFLVHKKEAANSIPCFLKVIELEPNHFGARYQLSIAYLETERFTDAAASARAAIKIGEKLSEKLAPTAPLSAIAKMNQQTAGAYKALGEALLRMKDIPGAREAWMKAAKLDPKRFSDLVEKLPQ